MQYLSMESSGPAGWEIATMVVAITLVVVVLTIWAVMRYRSRSWAAAESRGRNAAEQREKALRDRQRLERDVEELLEQFWEEDLKTMVDVYRKVYASPEYQQVLADGDELSSLSLRGAAALVSYREVLYRRASSGLDRESFLLLENLEKPPFHKWGEPHAMEWPVHIRPIWWNRVVIAYHRSPKLHQLVVPKTSWHAGEFAVLVSEAILRGDLEHLQIAHAFIMEETKYGKAVTDGQLTDLRSAIAEKQSMTSTKFGG